MQSLWDRIAATEGEVPVPEWHREVLEQRLAEVDGDPDAGRPWEEMEVDLRARLAKRQ